MKFLDSNIILYAYLKPRKGVELPERIVWRKKRSKEILRLIEEGKEEILISTVHLGEILNILSKKHNIATAVMFLGKILNMKNIIIAEVDKTAYKDALTISLTENIEPNDALAIVIMKRRNCREILTFDFDFYEIKHIMKPLLEEEIKLFGAP